MMMRLIFIMTALLPSTVESQAQSFWERANLAYEKHIRCSAVNSRGHIFVGTVDAGVFRSTNEGRDWSSNDFGLTELGILSFAINSSDHILVSTVSSFNMPVFRSTDNGNTWLKTNLSTRTVHEFIFNATGQIFAATENDGVFRSLDNGMNWTAANNGITDLKTRSIAITSKGHIFVGTHSGIFRSMDNGANWTLVNNGLPAARPVVEELEVNSNDHIFAATTQFSTSVFVSTDNGENWINTGFGIDVVTDLAINSFDHIFAATARSGVFRSPDNGHSWFQINSGLTNNQVYSLAITKSGYLYATTHGGGVFRSIKSTTSVLETSYEHPHAFDLSQNHPNPFNPATTVATVNKHIIGQTALIEVVEVGLAFKARIDTGAKRTSIHATNIEVDGESAVISENIGKEITFRAVNEKNESREVKTIIKDVSSVRNSQGQELRYVVEMELTWNGVSKKVKVNLRNREKMAYKLLIGRNWLANDFVVDVERDVPQGDDEDSETP